MSEHHDETIDTLVDDHLHGLLAPGDARHVERMIHTDPRWRAARAEAERRLAAMRELPAAEPTEDLVRRTLRRVEWSDRRKSTLRRRLLLGLAAPLAAAVVVLSVVHAYVANLAPSPYDLRIVGQSELLAGTRAGLRVHLTDRRTGRALARVPVELALHRGDAGAPARLAEFVTDERGTGAPTLSLPEWPDGEYELRVTARPGGEREELVRTLTLKRSWRLMLSSDKPVYQPGQTILMRSLALRRPDLEPVAGHETTFTVEDPKGNLIFKRRGVSSRFGIASAECPLADELIEGAYTLLCRVGDTESRRTVEVKRYVLPKLRVAVELDRPYYEPGQPLRGSVEADYFFGQPVAGGTVEVELRAAGAGPEAATVETLRSVTGADGRAEFEFRLPETLVGREQSRGDARIEVMATVTDTAGQSQSRIAARTVTVEPLRLEVVPESGRLVPSVANTVYVTATYADGRPAAVRVMIAGLGREMETGELGVASFELTPQRDEVPLTLRAVDAQGLVARRELTLSSAERSVDFLVRTDKAVYDGGDSLRLTVLSAGTEPVFVDLIKDGQTILTHSVAMIDGRGESALDLPPEVFGTLELVAYRFASDSGLPVRQARVIYVRQARGVDVALKQDRAEYRPGETARLTLSLTDHDGAPRPGAVSLAAVDEAVFSVLDAAPGMEKTFFTLERELLEPVYAVYPWGPDGHEGGKGEDLALLERALFARAADRRLDAGPDGLQRLIDEGYVTRDLIDSARLMLDSDWGVEHVERMVEDGDISREIVDLLRGRMGGTFTLTAASYPAKAQRIAAQQRAALERVKQAWFVLGLVGGGVVIVVGLVLLPNLVIRLVVLLGLLAFIVGLLLPSLGAARRTSNQMKAMTALRGLDQSMEIARQSGGLGESSPLAADGSAAPPRVRQWFPETLLWRPELITDDAGRVTIDAPLADSITTWRLTASAVTADGRLGALEAPLRVFQPFFVDLNLPVALTRGDEVAAPVVVYNYLDRPQRVLLELKAQDWFEGLDEPRREVELAPREVRAVHYRLRAKRVGRHELEVAAFAEGVADAVRRQIEVAPDGRRHERAVSGTLYGPAAVTLELPPDAVEGSGKLFVKLYPSSFSQVVEGIESIFRMPSGCFEQTSSTTYPNVLALDYLRRTGKSVPSVEATAKQYIHLGYQRLLTFEIDGGGFDWFGRPPANRTLTAYGLMEFQDMARVHDVDPELIARTRRWLLAQRRSDGSWDPEGHAMHEPPGGRSRSDARLKTTAYIAWALWDAAGARGDAAQAGVTRRFLLGHAADAVEDPYTLALVANALLAIDPTGNDARPYLDRLHVGRSTSTTGDLAWWVQPDGLRTVFYGSGQAADVEATALAGLALIRGGRHGETARGALAWLVTQKDGRGTWHSTQATVLALRALLAGTGAPLGGERARRIELTVNDDKTLLDIPADQGEVVQQADLSSRLRPGANRVELRDLDGGGVGYTVAFRYHAPEEPIDAATDAPLAIDLRYDRANLAVGETVAATAVVANLMDSAAPMVVLDLPIPGGFEVETPDFVAMVAEGRIARYQLTPRSVIVYLRELPPREPLRLEYRLRATMPVKLNVPPARVYEYYDPEREDISEPAELRVS